MNAAKIFNWWMPSLSSFDLDTGFDIINLQSNSPSRFTLATNAISSWLDISGNNNHATQGSAGAKPQYTGGVTSWDGGDQLNLTSEINRMVYTMYIVFKRTAVNSSSFALFGAGDGVGGNTNNFLRLDGSSTSTERKFTINGVNRPATSNATGVWRLGAEEHYTVLCIRRNNATFTITSNDRTLRLDSINANFATHPTYISKIGAAWSSLYLNGNILAFSMRSDVVDDATHASIRNSYYERYGILALAQDDITFIGDSMTEGGAIALSYPSYVNAQGAAMGLPYVNLGIAGQKASDGLARYQAQSFNRPYASKKVQILFGANDINGGVSAASFGADMRSMFAGHLSRGYPASNLMILTPMYQTANAHAAELTAYKNECLSIRDDLGIRCYDLLTAARNHGSPDSLIGDGIHPNAAGNAFIAAGAAAAWAA